MSAFVYWDVTTFKDHSLPPGNLLRCLFDAAANQPHCDEATPATVARPYSLQDVELCVLHADTVLHVRWGESNEAIKPEAETRSAPKFVPQRFGSERALAIDWGRRTNRHSLPGDVIAAPVKQLAQEMHGRLVSAVWSTLSNGGPTDSLVLTFAMLSTRPKRHQYFADGCASALKMLLGELLAMARQHRGPCPIPFVRVTVVVAAVGTVDSVMIEAWKTAVIDFEHAMENYDRSSISTLFLAMRLQKEDGTCTKAVEDDPCWSATIMLTKIIVKGYRSSGPLQCSDGPTRDASTMTEPAAYNLKVHATATCTTSDGNGRPPPYTVAMSPSHPPSYASTMRGCTRDVLLISRPCRLEDIHNMLDAVHPYLSTRDTPSPMPHELHQARTVNDTPLLGLLVALYTLQRQHATVRTPLSMLVDRYRTIERLVHFIQGGSHGRTGGRIALDIEVAAAEQRLQAETTPLEHLSFRKLLKRATDERLVLRSAAGYICFASDLLLPATIPKGILCAHFGGEGVNQGTMPRRSFQLPPPPELQVGFATWGSSSNVDDLVAYLVLESLWATQQSQQQKVLVRLRDVRLCWIEICAGRRSIGGVASANG